MLPSSFWVVEIVLITSISTDRDVVVCDVDDSNDDDDDDDDDSNDDAGGGKECLMI